MLDHYHLNILAWFANRNQLCKAALKTQIAKKFVSEMSLLKRRRRPRCRHQTSFSKQYPEPSIILLCDFEAPIFAFLMSPCGSK